MSAAGIVAIAIVTASGTVAIDSVAPDFRAIDFTVMLDDFETGATLTVPARADGPFPTVLLIHGATPADRDFTLIDPMSGDTLSTVLKDIAEYLSVHGFAAVRYDKRYVTGPGEVDMARFATLTLQNLLADATRVLNVALEMDEVDPDQIYVYGWSEGSAIAGQLAVTRADIKGLIVQGPVVHSFADVLSGQFERVSLPYLEELSVDGEVDLESLVRARGGSAGLLARSHLGFLLDPRSPSEPVINPFMDADGNGRINLEQEALPMIRRFLADDPATLGSYASVNALPGLLDLVDGIEQPVLVLQGRNDANVPARHAEELADALRNGGIDVTLRLYDGLGHSLGPARDLLTDNFLPPAPHALADMVDWLRHR